MSLPDGNSHVVQQAIDKVSLQLIRHCMPSLIHFDHVLQIRCCNFTWLITAVIDSYIRIKIFSFVCRDRSIINLFASYEAGIERQSNMTTHVGGRATFTKPYFKIATPITITDEINSFWIEASRKIVTHRVTTEFTRRVSVRGGTVYVFTS